MKSLSSLFLCLLLVHIACKTNKSTVSAPHATQKSNVQSAAGTVNSSSSIKSLTKVLILGNSITEHGPVESIGWKGSWGMAASSREKDFVHVLIDSLQKKYPHMTWDYRYQNIAYWENKFRFNFRKNKGLRDLVKYKPQILIIRLGENVDYKYAKSNNYLRALERLIHKFKGPESRIIVTNSFWPSNYKDSIQQQVAIKNNYAFVDLTDLSTDAKNQALGEFENGGVAAHPSDYGMNNIAVKILQRISEEGWVLKK